MNAGDPVEWYLDIPVVSRAYLTLSFLTTAACALDVVSPFSLYFNSALIWQKGQVHTLTHIHTYPLFGKGGNKHLTPMLLLLSPCPGVEVSNQLYVLWGLWHRLCLPHVLYVSLQSLARRKLFSRSNCRLCVDAHVWSCYHDCESQLNTNFSALLLWSLMPLSPLLFWPLSACCTLCEHSLSWLLTDIHDGLRLGSTQSLRANEVATSQPPISATLHPHPPPCSDPLPPPTRVFLSVVVPAFWVCSHSTPLTCPGCCFPSPTCWGAPPRR